MQNQFPFEHPLKSHLPQSIYRIVVRCQGKVPSRHQNQSHYIQGAKMSTKGKYNSLQGLLPANRGLFFLLFQGCFCLLDIYALHNTV